MTKNIKFIPSFQLKNFWNVIDTPSSAKSLIPEWYKKEPMWKENNKYLLDGPNGITFKGCIPFLDAIISGYMIKTWCEIKVVNQDGIPRISWGPGPEPAVVREPANMPIPLGCSEQHFAWNLGFGFEIPKGYSMLVTHPMNRFDLPFITTSAIIDESIMYPGKASFWIKKDFQGIIPINTPIAQIIPFKREDWNSTRSEELSERAFDQVKKKNFFISGFYKKNIHQKKDYK